MNADDAERRDPREGARRDLFVIVASTLAFGSALAARRFMNVWITIAISAGLAIALAASRGRPVRPLSRAAVRDVVLGLVFGALMSAATILIVPITVSWIPGLDLQIGQLYADLQDPPGPIRAIPILLAAVVAEELVWRGVLVRRMRARSPTTIILIASLAYAIPQVFSGSWVLVALALVCGLVWTAQRVIAGSLILPLITHVVWDLAIFIAWPLA